MSFAVDDIVVFKKRSTRILYRVVDHDVGHRRIKIRIWASPDNPKVLSLWVEQWYLDDMFEMAPAMLVIAIMSSERRRL